MSQLKSFIGMALSLFALGMLFIGLLVLVEIVEVARLRNERERRRGRL